AVLRVNGRLDEPLGVSNEPRPFHAAVVPPFCPGHPEAFRDFLREQVAVLETALTRPALDMEINPTGPLMPLRRVQPFLLLIRKVCRLQAGLEQRHTSDTKSECA